LLIQNIILLKRFILSIFETLTDFDPACKYSATYLRPSTFSLISIMQKRVL